MLTSRLSPRLSRAGFLLLPPHLRLATYNRSLPNRLFSSIPAQSVESTTNLTDIILAIPNGVLDGLHTMGLPWWATIPTSAFLVQGSLLYFRSDPNIIRHLMPLATVKMTLEQRNDPQKFSQRLPLGHLGRRPQSLLQWDRMLMMFSSMRQLKKKFKVPSTWLQVGSSFFLLIAFTEAIRLKAGAGHGLLSTINDYLKWIGNIIAPGVISYTPPQRSLSLEEQYVQKHEAWKAAQNQDSISVPDGETLAQLPTTSPGNLVSANPITYFDPTLSQEGMLWFQNLTLPDPALITFPIALAALTVIPILTAAHRRRSAVINATQNPTVAPLPTGIDPNSEAGRAINQVSKRKKSAPLTLGEKQRLTITLLFCWVIPQFPAGVALYFVSSLAAGRFWRRLAAVRQPSVPAMKPCVRLMRVGPRQGWSEY
ncbi:hypothetical protein MBLNU230_g0688t1 [Neophaeotheca triangularis]